MTDITLDRDVMCFVAGTGVVTDATPHRVARASAWLAWEDGQLWCTTPGRRRIPPMAERQDIVREAAHAHGYPGGARLKSLLATRYYWQGLAKDCVQWC